MRVLISRDADHSALYRVFLEVRDAAAKILENTTLADLISREPAGSRPNVSHRKKMRNRKIDKKKKTEPSVLPMVARGVGND